VVNFIFPKLHFTKDRVLAVAAFWLYKESILWGHSSSIFIGVDKKFPTTKSHCYCHSVVIRYDWLKHNDVRKKVDAVKIIIPKKIKLEVRDKLVQLNINEKVLFLDLEGLSAWLKRHYAPLKYTTSACM